MTDNMKKFLEAVSNDAELKEKIKNKSLNNEDEAKNLIIELAKEKGFTLRKEDFEKKDCEELTDDEIASVCGGDGCGCPVAGGGGGTDSNGRAWGCACTVYGQGGDGVDNHWICDCVFVGWGVE